MNTPNIIALIFLIAVLAYMFRKQKKTHTTPADVEPGAFLPSGWNVLYMTKTDPMDADMKETIESLELAGELHSLDLVKSLAASVAAESEYAEDEGWLDDWTFRPEAVVQAIKTHDTLTIRNDCDWQRALLWVLKELGWKQTWLAECCVYVQVPSVEKRPGSANHYIGSVYIPGAGWYGLNCWAYGVVYPLSTIAQGGYEGNGYKNLPGCEFVSYRLLSETEWKAGTPA